MPSLEPQCKDFSCSLDAAYHDNDVEQTIELDASKECYLQDGGNTIKEKLYLDDDFKRF